MKYIENTPFFSITGEPLTIREDTGPEHEASTADVLKLVMSFYDGQHAFFVQQGHILKPSETRRFNLIMDILKEDGETIALEDEDFRLLKRISEWVLPVASFWRQAPLIEDVLENAKAARPSNGVVHKPGPVAVS